MDILRDGVTDLPDLSTLPADGGPQFNRLVFTSSPYLLQHARNPVDWYPWGDEAFARAAREHKPVFLSIGYSTCHWCHVMEHESFEDPEVAAMLNAHFIAIKVDREERPDVDHIYMTACQSMTGSGGWPLSVFITPDKRPFYSGTYFPKEDRFGRPGFLRVLRALHDAWMHEADKVERIAADMHASLQRLGEDASARRPASSGLGALLTAETTAAAGSPGALSAAASAVLAAAEEAFLSTFDVECGGFGSAPKFPMGHALSFLLRRNARSDNTALLYNVEHTLRAMHRGGMYDHVGGGFCRYSTDRHWLVPHFEKMLYDNALLVMAYTDAWQRTGDAAYAEIVRDVIRYITTTMTSREGYFYSAENADSEGVEGKFYVFTRAEFLDIAGAEYGDALAEYFGVSEAGNFEHPGWNVLSLAVDEGDWARRHGFSAGSARMLVDAARAKLYAARAARVHPSLDDKVLVSWNGLMIAALARAGAAVGDAPMRDAAVRAVDALLARARREDGRLWHRLRGTEAGIEGFLEDYAFLAWGLLELYDATFDLRHLREAVSLSRLMLEEFEDAAGGGFYTTAAHVRDVPVRAKESYDGAIPSGNGVAAWVLVRLARLTGDAAFEQRALDIIEAFLPIAERAPSGFTMLLTALDVVAGPSQEIVLVAPDAAALAPHIAELHRRWTPHAVHLVRTDANAAELAALAPFTASMQAVDRAPTRYVCEKHACSLPERLA